MRRGCLVLWMTSGGLAFGCAGSSSDGPATGADTGGVLTVTATMTDSTSSGDDGGFTSTGSTGGPSGSTGEINCGESEFVLEAVAPNVMLVLDKSGSMLTDWDQDGDMIPDGTRWNSLYSVTEFVVNTFNDKINFGATLFPNTSAQVELGEQACLTNTTPEVGIAPMNSGSVLGGIPAPTATNLRGATPASRGMATAVSHLNMQDPTVDKFIILVTDGAANCSASADLSLCPGPGCELMELYDSNLPIVVGDALNLHGIPTFVVGINIVDALVGVGNDGQPEANTYQELNTVADAGGMARPGMEKFFNADNEPELQAALEEIAGQVVSCVVPFDEEPDNPAFVEVEIDGMLIPQVTDCATENGWVYVNPNGPYDAIELCGTACQSLADFGSVDATFGCPPAG